MAGNSFKERFPQHDEAAAQLLAVNVRRLRKTRGLTQDQLAAELDVEQSAVSLIENARANPALLLLDAIARALNCHMRDLFEESATKASVRARAKIG